MELGVVRGYRLDLFDRSTWAVYTALGVLSDRFVKDDAATHCQVDAADIRIIHWDIEASLWQAGENVFR